MQMTCFAYATNQSKLADFKRHSLKNERGGGENDGAIRTRLCFSAYAIIVRVRLPTLWFSLAHAYETPSDRGMLTSASSNLREIDHS